MCVRNDSGTESLRLVDEGSHSYMRVLAVVAWRQGEAVEAMCEDSGRHAIRPDGRRKAAGGSEAR